MAGHDPRTLVASRGSFVEKIAGAAVTSGDREPRRYTPRSNDGTGKTLALGVSFEAHRDDERQCLDEHLALCFDGCRELSVKHEAKAAPASSALFAISSCSVALALLTASVQLLVDGGSTCNSRPLVA